MQQNHKVLKEDFRIRPGGRYRPQESPGRLLRKARTAAEKLARRSRGGFGRGKHAGQGYLLTRHPQRVTIKINYYKQAGKKSLQRLGAHLKYVQRQAATVDDERPLAYSAGHDQVDAKEMVQGWEADDKHWRVIISPENAMRINDMRGYIRDVMARIEKDLETKLEWFAVDHYNTDNPHTHVVIRGKDDQGQELRIHPEYIKSGFRHRAAEVATELLGPREVHEIEESRKQEVTAERVTSLDRRIEAGLDGDRRIDLRQGAANTIPEYERGRVIGRLQYLEDLGLAKEAKHGRWQVAEGFLEEMRARGRQHDITKRLFDRMPDRAAHVVEYEVSGFETPPVKGQVVAKGQHDELGTRNFVVIRDADGRDFYVTVSDKIDLTRIGQGSLVKAGPLTLPDGKAETNIVREAHSGVYDPKGHEERVRAGGKVEDPAAYVGRHVARLTTLEHQGHVEQLQDGRWRVPPDLPERALAEAEAMRQNPILQRYTQLTNVSGQPVQELPRVRTWTYLDRVIEKHPEGLPPDHDFAGFLGKALEDRKNWLMEQGYGRADHRGRFSFDARAKSELRQAGRAPARESAREDRGAER